MHGVGIMKGAISTRPGTARAKSHGLVLFLFFLSFFLDPLGTEWSVPFGVSARLSVCRGRQWAAKCSRRLPVAQETPVNPCRDVTWMEPHRRSLLVPRS